MGQAIGSEPWIVLALDPSSTRTGYAVFCGQQLMEAGFFKPARPKDRALVRIQAMASDVAELIQELKVEHVVIEVPSGRAGTGSRRGASSSLAIYGMAVGAIWMAAGGSHSAVTDVDERTWTRRYRIGRRTADKASRRNMMGLKYPTYAQVIEAGGDSGGDVCDAIGIGEWWLSRKCKGAER